MRRILLLIGLLLLTALPVAAQVGQVAYIQTDTAPEAGMFPIGTTFSMVVLNAQNGQWETRPARIEHYIQWVNPSRPAEYYVALTDWPGAFFFHNRATLEQWVTLQRLVVRLLGQDGRG